MKRILITGMSGTGKSTLVVNLVANGYTAVDLDTPGWSEYAQGGDGGNRLHDGQSPEWVWREQRVSDLLTSERAETLFVSGCASNQGKFYRYFDDVVLLTAPVQLIVERLASRTNNAYGKEPAELLKVLSDIEEFEPVLRRSASLEIDTAVGPDQVLAQVVELAQRGEELR